MNLKPRFMLLTALLFAVTAVGVSWSVQKLAEDIIAHWASRFIVKQALYDKSRTLQPILRDLALSRQLAASNLIKQWSHSPDNPALTQAALEELENYRVNFRDQSYFVALLANGHYYHNNSANEFRGKELRYTLNPTKEADSWFYNLIEQKRDIHINVNPDAELGVTKLWIDVLIKDQNKILGIAGTGLDLTEFLNLVVEENEPGVLSLFIDHSGAIQLHRDKTLIDYGSVTKNAGAHNTIDLIFKNQDDLATVYSAMEQLESGEQQVVTTFVDQHNTRQLVGIVYLPELDWYQITIIDLSSLLPLSNFSKIVLMFVVTLLVTLILFNLVLTRLVLNPISQLEHAMRLFKQGKNPTTKINLQGKGELGRLNNHFMQMVESVLESKRDLEQKVQDRTADLERLAQIDPLTELYNRRGMTDQINNNLDRINREHGSFGLLLLDIDWFKQLNDTYGHATGDEALKSIAKIIKSNIRSYDLAARWGGDEFLILLSSADNQTITQLAERLCSSIVEHDFHGDSASLSASIGCALPGPDTDLTTLLQQADLALYEAKEKGRNCFCLFHNAA